MDLVLLVIRHACSEIDRKANINAGIEKIGAL